MSPQEAIDAISQVMTSDQEARLEIAAILAQVEDTPPQGIDRDALTEVIYECGVDGLSDDERLATAVTDVKIARQVADAILALVRPVEGIVLTREEAQLAVYALRHVGDGTVWRKPEHNALAARLKAVSA